MKRLMLLLILALPPISVDAGVRFETYDVTSTAWDIDTTLPVIYHVEDSVGHILWDLDTTGMDITIYDTWGLDSAIITHDTLREYIVGLDTVIILHRIECDTAWTDIWYSKGGDSAFVRMHDAKCDTIFRVEYRDVWAPKVQVWLDSLQWQTLLRMLEPPYRGPVDLYGE